MRAAHLGAAGAVTYGILQARQRENTTKRV